MIKKHPTLPIWCDSENGMVLLPEIPNPHKLARWTHGGLAKTGYMRVMINKKEYRVHRLIAETFLDNPENKPTVDHINRIKTDNRLCNIRWATPHEQIENGRALGREDFGVRECEDRKSYDAARYAAIKADPVRWGKYREKRVAWEIRTGRRKQCTVE